MVRWFVMGMLLVGIGTAIGCADTARSVDVRQRPILDSDTFDRMALMPVVPVDRPARLDTSRSGGLDCTIDELCSVENMRIANAAGALTFTLHDRLVERFGYRILDLEESLAAYDAQPSDRDSDTLRAAAVAYGKALDADNVFVGLIWRYRERAETDGASVAFSLSLVSVANGRAVWMGTFDQTQTSLNENILKTPTFLKKEFRWYTARELTAYGAEEVVSRIPGLEAADMRSNGP